MKPNDQLLDAAIRGKVSEMEQALTRGADVNCKDKNGNTPFILAARYGLPDAMNALEWLLEAGARIDERGENEQTALHQAIMGTPKPPIVKFLLEKGANPNLQDDKGMTPLHWASCSPNPDNQVISALIDAGAEPTITNHDGVDARWYTPTGQRDAINDAFRDSWGISDDEPRKSFGDGILRRRGTGNLPPH